MQSMEEAMAEVPVITADKAQLRKTAQLMGQFSLFCIDIWGMGFTTDTTILPIIILWLGETSHPQCEHVPFFPMLTLDLTSNIMDKILNMLRQKNNIFTVLIKVMSWVEPTRCQDNTVATTGSR